MDGVNKTLYIPLYGKALVSRRGLFLRDPMAERIWEAEGFALKGKAKSKWLAYNMGMRAAVFDRWTREQMEKLPEAVVLHLGCGMDSRAERTGAQRLWYDVDFHEVIRERKRYFRETDTYHMISGDLRQEEWLQGIPGGRPAIVVMEGLSMYLRLPELKGLLERLVGHFTGVVLLMDTYTVFAAKATKYKNPINTVGVTEVFGFDDPEEPIQGTGFRFLSAHSLTPEDMIRSLPRHEQGFFRRLFAGKTAGRIYRLYEYQTDFDKI